MSDWTEKPYERIPNETEFDDDPPQWNMKLSLSDHGTTWLTFDVRADGCVHVRRYFSGAEPGKPRGAPHDPSHDKDYMHICNLREFITHLQEVERRAVAKWGGWPT